MDRRCRESEGKAKIEGYMSVSDEEAHQRYVNLYILHKLVFTSIIVHILPDGLLKAIDHLISSTIASYENF